MEKKDYIIVDENNNWLALSRQVTADELKAEATDLKAEAKGLSNHDVMIYAYEIVGESIDF